MDNIFLRIMDFQLKMNNNDLKILMATNKVLTL